MSQTVVFEIGAVIFVGVTTAVFLYGLMWFREWQDRDDVQAAIDVREGSEDRIEAVGDGSACVTTRASTDDRSAPHPDVARPEPGAAVA